MGACVKNKGGSDRNADSSVRDSSQSGKAPDKGRRRFSRAALGGGAVLASLGSRPAWTQTGLGCMSVTTIASFNPQTGMFVSAPGGRPEHNEALAAEIHRVVGPNNPDYLGIGVGSDGEIYTACRSRDTTDNVCLIKGEWRGNKCPPPPIAGGGPPGQGGGGPPGQGRR
jgi:hypothetical protein